MRESDFIEWIRSQSRFDPAAVPVGPGDDCAIVMCGGEKLLITTDQLLDGVHVVLREHGAFQAGRKAMARNLSDVAAMAATPLAAVATVAFPRDFSRADAEQLYQGLRSLDKDLPCPIVGGDVGVWSGPLAITVTVFARPAGIRQILRSGAKVGDAVCVTGAFGGAWKGQRHLTFTPRVKEARTLASRHELHAMIDVSDGLVRDLGHICKASGVGAEIYAEKVPIHPELQAGGAEPQALLEAALQEGEDYELLFALPADEADQLLESQPLGVKVSRIGAIVEGKDLTLVHPDGKRQPCRPKGWEHETSG